MGAENSVERKWKFKDEFWFEVRFVLNAERVDKNVSRVYLAGDFNQWKILDDYEMAPSSEGYCLTLPLSQGYYQYKFVLMVAPEETIFESDVSTACTEESSHNRNSDARGEESCSGVNAIQPSKNVEQIWIRDPANPHVGGVHGNSIMFVHMDPGVYGIRPQNAPCRTYQRWGSDGSEFQILCPVLPSEIEALGILQRWIFIYLPPSYGREETRRYPVLYANDGEALFSTPEHAGGPCKGGYYLDEKLDYFWDKNLLPEFILVGIPNSDFVCIGNRNREYCTSVFHDTTGDPYKRYLVEVVKKEIDNKFRTLPDGANTVIMGGSMGGLCAFTLSLNHPDIFSSAVCISSSFWFVDKHNKTAYDLLRSHSRTNFTNSGSSDSNSNVGDEGNVCAAKLTVLSSSFSAQMSDPADSSLLPALPVQKSSPTNLTSNVLPNTIDPSFVTPYLRPRIYIDSGDGPGDNCYETKDMKETFLECGWKEGEEFMYVLDECAKNTDDGITHLEVIWKERILPALQFAFKFK